MAILAAEIAGRLRMVQAAAKRGVMVAPVDLAELPPLEIDGVSVLTFEEAAAFAKARLPLTSKTLTAMVDRARQRGWAATIQARDDLHVLVDNRISAFLEEGGSVRDWTRTLGDELTALGLDPGNPYRLETILRNNLSTAYSAGRMAMLEEPGMAEAFPYWIYRTVGDSAVRPAHAAMDGRAYPTGHPIWNEWTPPCGHSCRCSIQAASAEDLADEGIRPSHRAPRVGRVLARPDAGFRFNGARAFLKDGLAGLTPSARREAERVLAA